MPVAAVPPTVDQKNLYGDHLSKLSTALGEQPSDAKAGHVEKAVAALNQHVDQLRSENVDVAQLLTPEGKAKLEEAKRFGLAPDYVSGLDNFLATGADHTNDAQGVNLSATMRERADAALAANETAATGNTGTINSDLLELKKHVEAFPPLTPEALAEVNRMRKTGTPEEKKIAMATLGMEAQATEMRTTWAEMQKFGSLSDMTAFLKGDFEALSPEMKTEVITERQTRNEGLPRAEQVKAETITAEHGEKLRGMRATLMGQLEPLKELDAPGIKALIIAAQGNDTAGMLKAAEAYHKADLVSAGVGAAVTGAVAANIDPNLPGNVKNALTGLADAKRDYQEFAERNFSEIESLINSNLPIELIVCLVLLKISERQREKVKLKMRELAAAESMEAAKESKAIFSGVEEKIREANPGISDEQLTEKVNAAKAEIQIAHDQRLQTARETHKIPQLQTAIQKLQFEQNQLKQLMDTLSNVLRVIQDMAATPIRHIR